MQPQRGQGEVGRGISRPLSPSLSRAASSGPLAMQLSQVAMQRLAMALMSEANVEARGTEATRHPEVQEPCKDRLEQKYVDWEAGNESPATSLSLGGETDHRTTGAPAMERSLDFTEPLSPTAVASRQQCQRCGLRVRDLLLHQARCAQVFQPPPPPGMPTGSSSKPAPTKGVTHISSDRTFADLLDPLTKMRPRHANGDRKFQDVLHPLTKLALANSVDDQRFQKALRPLTKLSKSADALVEPLSPPLSPWGQDAPRTRLSRSRSVTPAVAAEAGGPHRYTDFASVVRELASATTSTSAAGGHRLPHRTRSLSPPMASRPKVTTESSGEMTCHDTALAGDERDDALYEVLSRSTYEELQHQVHVVERSTGMSRSACAVNALLMERVRILQEELQRVAAQKDLLAAVLQIVATDLHLKNEQFDTLYTNLSLNPVWADAQERKGQTAAVLRESGQMMEDMSTLTIGVDSDAAGRTEDRSVHASDGPTAERELRTDGLSLPFSAPSPTRSSSSSGSNYSALPAELLTLFCSFLPYQDICLVCGVCKQWAVFGRDQFLWERVFQHRWCVDTRRYVTERLWKQEFEHRFKVHRKWVQGKPNVMTMSKHTGTVTCLKYDDRHLISGSDDGSMIVWDLQMEEAHELQQASSTGIGLMQQHHKHTKTTNRVSSFVGHGGPVWCLDFDGATVVSGSYDQTIKVWNVKSGKNLRTLRGHDSWVSCVQLHQDRILSGSWDSSLKLWSLDLENGQDSRCLQTLVGAPGNAVYCHQWNPVSNVVATGCRQEAVQVWDLNTARMTENLMGHTKQVYCLQFDESKLVSGSGDNTIKVWDRKSSRCEMTLNGHINPVMALQMDQQHQIVTGSYDKSVRVWDMRMGRCLRTLFGHSSAVFCLQFDFSKIVSGSADRNIKIWDFFHHDESSQ